MKLKINKLDYYGRGISSKNGKVIFVKHALPGELVEGCLIKESKHYDIYETTKILEPSLIRKTSFCPYSKLCGGCTFDMVSYENSLEYKKNILNDLFHKNGIMKEIEITPSKKSLGYRNKITLKVKDNSYGYYKEESHEFIPVETCYLAQPAIQKCLKYIPSFQIEDGEIVIRANEEEEILISIKSNKKPNIDNSFIESFKVKGIIWNDKKIYGLDNFYEKIGKIYYHVHYNSFFQVNPYIAKEIIKYLKQNMKSSDILYDLYCGVGFFSLAFANEVKRVVGIEENKNACVDMKLNYMGNDIRNIKTINGKVEDKINNIKDQATKAIIDPPRSGLHKNVVNSLLNSNMKEIYYISCNPITLVRDLKLLQEKYEIASIHAFDMFPFTHHTECVVILNLKFMNRQSMV